MTEDKHESGRPTVKGLSLDGNNKPWVLWNTFRQLILKMRLFDIFFSCPPGESCRRGSEW